MTQQPLIERISVDPQVAHGRPVVRGTRVWVVTVLDQLADGQTPEDLLTGYPQLEPDDVRACLAYAADLTRRDDVTESP